MANPSASRRSHTRVFAKEETATNAAAPRCSGCVQCYCQRENYEQTDPERAAHVGTSSAPAWQACTPSALPPERAEPAASSGFLPWAVSYPLPSLSPLSHPCMVLQQRFVQVDDKHEGCADSGCENPFSSCLSLPRCC